MQKEGLYLVLGGIIGGFVGWFITRTYYKKEISEIREAHAQIDKEKVSQNDEKCVDTTNEVGEGYTVSKEDLHEYAELLRSQGYTDGAREERKEIAKAPYTIAPDEFGEDPDNYECLSFTYYADGILTDDTDEPVVNVNDVVGDALNHIGEYEPDAVYVRNERLGLEYEILRDERKYSEVEREKPRPVEIEHEDGE